MNSLLRITRQQLPKLSHIYKSDEYPLHNVSYICIDHFIDRFTRKPGYEDKVKFWTLNETWMQNGTFAMVNDNDGHILFNTLEPYPHTTMRQTLERLEIEDEKVFICFRDIFRAMVHDVMRVQCLEKTFDSGTRLIYYPRANLAKLGTDIEAPEGFYFDTLTLDNVAKINSSWAQRASRSHELITTFIKENPSTGLYHNETGELVAWCLMLETGGLGNLQVDEKYLKKGFGSKVYIKQILKVGRDFNRELCGHVAHQNSLSLYMAMKLGAQWIDNNSWIGVRKKEKSKMVPLWGRL